MTPVETIAWLTTLRDNARTVPNEALAEKCEEAIACILELVKRSAT